MSRETEAIVGYVEAAGLPHRVTAVLGTWVSAANPCSPHAAGSLHCAEGTDGKGLAVDLGGAAPGTSLEALAQMAAIHAALMKVAPQLQELIHNGPGITKAVKNGKVVDGLRVYGLTTWNAHRNHVHVAAFKGAFIEWPEPIGAQAVPPTGKKVLPLYDPPIAMSPVVADLACPTGGAWTLHTDGGIGGWGGARVTGSVVGKPYWLLPDGKPRTPARLELSADNRPVTVATSGEKYGPEY